MCSFGISYIRTLIDGSDFSVDIGGYSKFDGGQARVGGFDSQIEASMDNGQG